MLSWAEQFRAMSFAQLTWRESLRDIEVSRSANATKAQRVMLTAKKYPEHLRRIRCRDPESGKTLVFLTNTTALPALTICALYKSRWHIATYVLIAVGLPTNANQLILFDF